MSQGLSSLLPGTSGSDPQMLHRILALTQVSLFRISSELTMSWNPEKTVWQDQEKLACQA